MIEDCKHVNIQLATASGMIIVRNCEGISLSACCERLVIEWVNTSLHSLHFLPLFFIDILFDRFLILLLYNHFLIVFLLTIRSSFQLLLYIYSPSNPLILSSLPSHIIVAPYNIPRPGLINQLASYELVGRNCWDYGVDVGNVIYGDLIWFDLIWFDEY